MAGLTNFSNGISTMGIPIIGQPFGKTYFVDPSGGLNGNKGTSTNQPWKTLTYAFTQLVHYDTLILKPGDYTGNYTTPINATAAFVRIIGVRTHENGLAAWMGATTASSPIIDVRARGWSFEGIEFDCPTGAAAVRLTKSVDGTTHRCDFVTIKHSIFTTGKYGVEVNGGGTHVHIHHCKFDQLTTTGAFAIISKDNSHQIPAFWVVEDNIFATSLNHIGPANASQGWSESTFRRNVHQADGVGTNVSMMLDIRAGAGGGNMVLDNYFDMTAAEWTTGDTDAKIRTNSTDFGAGNECNDGPAETVINV